jgi:hypothetical protein
MLRYSLATKQLVDSQEGLSSKVSALSAGRPLPSGRFLVLISVKRPSRPQGYSAARRIRSIENIHLIRVSNR